MSASNVYYLDASVLVKLFIDESGSEKVRKVRDEESAQMVTSWPMLISTVKVLKKKRRLREIDGKKYTEAIRDLFALVAGGKLKLTDERDQNGNSVFAAWNEKIRELDPKHPGRELADILFMALVKSGFITYAKK